MTLQNWYSFRHWISLHRRSLNDRKFGKLARFIKADGDAGCLSRGARNQQVIRRHLLRVHSDKLNFEMKRMLDDAIWEYEQLMKYAKPALTDRQKAAVNRAKRYAQEDADAAVRRTPVT